MPGKPAGPGSPENNTLFKKLMFILNTMKI
jgi:hypothetical protein